MSEAVRLAARAVEFGQDDSEVLWRVARTLLQSATDTPRAAKLVYRALDINPNSSIAMTIAGWIETVSGNSDKALELFRRARRLSPRDPRGWTVDGGMAHAHYHRGEYAESLALAQKALSANPRFSAALWFQVAALGKLGDKEKTTAAVADLLKIEPQMTISRLQARTRYAREDVWLEIAEGLRLAGIPE
jgi:tetratricopeptide (TPR) repeat protein